LAPSFFLLGPFTSLADPFTSLAETFTSLTWLHFFISIDSLHAVCCTQVSISAAPGAKTPRRLTFSGDQRLWRITQGSRLLRRSAAPVPSSSCAWPPRPSAAPMLDCSGARVFARLLGSAVLLCARPRSSWALHHNQPLSCAAPVLGRCGPPPLRSSAAPVLGRCDPRSIFGHFDT
jgi:hypothetical protein